jgi:hypothetical protein
VLATRSYDQLARPVTQQYPNASDNITWTWTPEDDLSTLTGNLASTTNDVTFTRLMTCYGVIVTDSRHVDPRLMGIGPIPKRSFYNWDMCSRRLNNTNNAVLKALDVKGPFSPKTLNFEKALKLLMAIRVVQSRPEPMAA